MATFFRDPASDEALRNARTTFAEVTGHKGTNSVHLVAALIETEDPDVLAALATAKVNVSKILAARSHSFRAEDTGGVLAVAAAIAASEGQYAVTSSALLRAILTFGISFDDELLKQSVDPQTLFNAAGQRARAAAPAVEVEADGEPSLTRDLTAAARRGELDAVTGRDAEIERCMLILSRRTKANPLLVGPPGVGKTAIAEGIAQRIAVGKCPPSLKGKRVLQLDVAQLVAGTSLRGQFEQRLKNEIKGAVNDGSVMFIDELHTIVGAGAASGSMDAANILKPELARGALKTLGATTDEEYRKHLCKDAAIERRFQTVDVDVPDIARTVEILGSVHRPLLEVHHGVSISDEVLTAAAELADRYIRDRNMPDKAIDLVDEAAAYAAANGVGWDVTVEDVHSVLSAWTGIPVQRLGADEEALRAQLESELREYLHGQSEAISATSDAMRVARSGLSDPKKPRAALAFIGPKGSGKTMLAEAVAKYMIGDPEAIVRINLSEYTEKHSVARLIGSPPGYRDSENGGQLTEAVHKRPHTVVFFDETDKAHPAALDVIMQVLDDGRLTDGQGRTVDFRNTVVIVGGNFGNHEIKPGVGFGGGSNSQAAQIKALRRDALAQWEKATRPEFRDRFGNVVVFNYLDDASLRQVADDQLNLLSERAMASRQVTVVFDSSVADAVLAVEHNLASGGRFVQRTVQQLVSKRLGMELASVKRGETPTFNVSFDDAGIHITKGRAVKVTASKPRRPVASLAG